MPTRSYCHRATIAAAGAVALVAALPGTAAAAAHPGHKPVARSFTAHGLVVSHTSSSVTVLASDVHTGRSKSRNTPITVALPSRRTGSGKALAKKLARLTSGDRIAVTGTSTAGSFTARNLAGAPAPFHAYLGTVTSVAGTLVQVDKAAEPSDDATESATGSFTVDVSSADVTVDGAPADLAPGETVAVLGSSIHDVVVATSAFGYTTAPDAVAGEVTGVTGAVATIGATEDDSDAVSPTGTAIDLAAATLIVDGTSGATPDAITAGARLLALGTDNGDGTFTATTAFAFTHACSSRHHGDGGQDSGDDG